MERLRRLDAGVTRKGSYAAIFLGILGMAGIGAALPMYRHIVKKERERIVLQILKLTNELMQSENGCHQGTFPNDSPSFFIQWRQAPPEGR